MATDQVERTAVQRIVLTGWCATIATSPSRLAIGRSNVVDLPAIVDPRRVPELGDRRSGQQLVGRMHGGRGNQREPSLAGIADTIGTTVRRWRDDVVADLDLVGGDQQHGPT